jgi:hypothetical protein
MIYRTPVIPEIPTGDQTTLDYVGTHLRVALHSVETDPWYTTKSQAAQNIIDRLKAIELEIEQLSGIPAADQEDAL